MKFTVGFFILLFSLCAHAASKLMTDLEVKKMMVQGSVTDFEKDKDCACPWSKTRGGDCGENSAYFLKQGEERPFCYPEDITPEQVEAYRFKYGIPKRNELDRPLNQ